MAESHPCFGSAPAHSGRIHLPVAPICNLGCRFCSRGVAAEREHPGVAQRVIAPEEAVRYVEKALDLCPDIRVVGVAGPGDALASPHALEALAMVDKSWPGLTKCLSTNGLLLADRIDDVIAAGVGALTVTVSGVEARVIAELVSRANFGGRCLRGLAAAQLLIDRQLEGLRVAVAGGLLVKVNAVLVPGVNDDHLEELAETVAGLGVSSLNVIPLIPQHLMADRRAPSCQELHDARERVEQFLPAFRHCRQCRADAVGLISGRDLHREVFGELESCNTFSHG